MIGGTVIATRSIEDLIWINTRDNATGDECAIYVKADDKARCVSEGDNVWWQGELAMWTPRLKVTLLHGPRDVQLTKVGNSSSTGKPVKQKSRPLST